MTVAVGERFPIVPVETADGPLDLTVKWSEGPLVVAFHRMWCPFCQEAAAQLSTALPELRAMGADAVIIYREDVAKVAAACGERHTEATCASDPHRRLENAVEVERLRFTRFAAFAPSKLVRVLRSGAKIGPIAADVLQGRGTFVIDTTGRVTFVHVARTSADIPPIEDVIQAVATATNHRPTDRLTSPNEPNT